MNSPSITSPLARPPQERNETSTTTVDSVKLCEVNHIFTENLINNLSHSDDCFRRLLFCLLFGGAFCGSRVINNISRMALSTPNGNAEKYCFHPKGSLINREIIDFDSGACVNCVV